MVFGHNSTETHGNFDPMMHDVAFVLTATILTLITICIFYTIYKISVGEDRQMEMQLREIKEQRILAPHNTPDNTLNI